MITPVVDAFKYLTQVSTCFYVYSKVNTTGESLMLDSLPTAIC